jgi:hypothetical protein
MLIYDIELLRASPRKLETCPLEKSKRLIGHSHQGARADRGSAYHEVTKQAHSASRTSVVRTCLARSTVYVLGLQGSTLTCRCAVVSFSRFSFRVHTILTEMVQQGRITVCCLGFAEKHKASDWEAGAEKPGLLLYSPPGLLIMVVDEWGVGCGQDRC